MPTRGGLPPVGRSRSVVRRISSSWPCRPTRTPTSPLSPISDREILRLFLEVLMICDAMGLIGKEMFAVDGCKMASNASKEWSGTKEELEHKKEKMEKAIRQIIGR